MRLDILKNLKKPKFSITYRPFPVECGGNVYGISCESNGQIRIIIDSNQDERTQQHALRHELAHIVLNHFDDQRSIEDIEAEAEAYADQMTDKEFTALMEGAML